MLVLVGRAAGCSLARLRRSRETPGLDASSGGTSLLSSARLSSILLVLSVLLVLPVLFILCVFPALSSLREPVSAPGVRFSFRPADGTKSGRKPAPENDL